MSQQKRVASIDILRGIVMVIMALDHTRDFFHQSAMTADPLSPTSTTVPLFFTRWITHFCAPVFVFLSGTSIYLSSLNKDPRTYRAQVIKRGLWLILAEVTLVTFGISFNPFFHFIIFQVIWAIGFGMILLSLFSRLSYRAVVITGMLIVLLHNLTNYANLPETGVAAVAWKIFFTALGTFLPISSTHTLGFLYAVVPWTGVMFLGYGAGKWFTQATSSAERKKKLLVAGASMILLFIALRFLNQYGDPSPRITSGNFKEELLSFLNVSKYPPSLLYICMTLGPSLMVLALLENVRSSFTNILQVYGKVPFFYYILHFYLLHLILVVVFFLSGYGIGSISQPGNPFWFRPLDFGYGLGTVYLIWLLVVVILYYPSKWYGRYKSSRNHWWLRYL